jgi:hypothetical protein
MTFWDFAHERPWVATVWLCIVCMCVVAGLEAIAKRRK